MEQRHEQQYELSDQEEDEEADDKALFRTGMNYVSTAQDSGFVAELLSLLSLVNTDEKVLVN